MFRYAYSDYGNRMTLTNSDGTLTRYGVIYNEYNNACLNKDIPTGTTNTGVSGSITNTDPQNVDTSNTDSSNTNSSNLGTNTDTSENNSILSADYFPYVAAAGGSLVLLISLRLVRIIYRKQRRNSLTDKQAHMTDLTV